MQKKKKQDQAHPKGPEGKETTDEGSSEMQPPHQQQPPGLPINQQVYRPKMPQRGGHQGPNQRQVRNWNPHANMNPRMRMPGMNQKSGPGRDELCKQHFPEKIVTYDFDTMRAKCKVCLYEEMNSQYFTDVRNNEEIKGELQEGVKEGSENKPEVAAQGKADPLGIFKNELSKGTYSSMMNLVNSIKGKKDKLEKEVPLIDEAKRNSVAAYRILFKQLREKMKIEKDQLVSDIKSNVYDYKKNIDKENQLIREIIQNDLKNIAQASLGFYKHPSFPQKPLDTKIHKSQLYLQEFIKIDARIEKSFNEYAKDLEFNQMKEKDKDEVNYDFAQFINNWLRPDLRVKQSVRVEEEGLLKIIHSFQWKSRLIHLCNIEDKSFDSRQLHCSFDIPLYSRSIAIDNGDIYLTGGHMKPQNIYLKKTFKYDRLFNSFAQRSDMLFHHADHSLVYSNNCIFAVGAYVYGKCHGHTERYDVHSDTWIQCAQMRVPRSGVGLCSFNDRYLIAFGGRSEQRQILNVIEAYSIDRNEWKELNFVDKNQWVSSYMSLAYQINENEIMVMGGKSQLSNIITKNTYVLNMETGKFKDGPTLGNPSSFMNTTLVFNNEIFVYGNDNNIHKFSFVEHQWSIFKKRPKNNR